MQVAIAAGVDDSIISYMESDKPAKFKTLRKVLKKGLDVDDENYHMAKMLWLEQVTGEPAFTAVVAKARDALAAREGKAVSRFLDQAQRALLDNLDVIKRNQLEKVVLQTLSDSNSLELLPHFQTMVTALTPSKKPAKS